MISRRSANGRIECSVGVFRCVKSFVRRIMCGKVFGWNCSNNSNNRMVSFACSIICVSDRFR